MIKSYEQEQAALRKSIKRIMRSPQMRGKIQAICREYDLWPNNLYLWVNGKRGFSVSTLDKVKRAFGVK